jgi:hypothetical protein
VVAIQHEVHVADSIHLYRRDGLASTLGQRQSLPAFAHLAGRGAEPPVELSGTIHRTHDGVQVDHL